MRSVQSSGPYHVSGWSFGGVVAFEIARQLVAQGEAPGVVALLESHAPLRRGIRWRALRGNLRFLGGFAWSGIEAARDSIYLSTARLRERTAESNGELNGLQRLWLNTVYQAYLRKAGLSEVVEQNEMLLGLHHPSIRKFLAVASANLKARRRYRPSPYSAPLTLFVANDQPKTLLTDSGQFGWRDLAPDGAIDVHVVEGDHFKIMRNPHVTSLARALQRLLDGFDSAGKQSLPA
jgi:thioesterase domain-containing protein